MRRLALEVKELKEAALTGDKEKSALAAAAREWFVFLVLTASFRAHCICSADLRQQLTVQTAEAQALRLLASQRETELERQSGVYRGLLTEQQSRIASSEVRFAVLWDCLLGRSI